MVANIFGIKYVQMTFKTETILTAGPLLGEGIITSFWSFSEGFLVYSSLVFYNKQIVHKSHVHIALINRSNLI